MGMFPQNCANLYAMTLRNTSDEIYRNYVHHSSIQSVSYIRTTTHLRHLSF